MNITWRYSALSFMKIKTCWHLLHVSWLRNTQSSCNFLEALFTVSVILSSDIHKSKKVIIIDLVHEHECLIFLFGFNVQFVSNWTYLHSYILAVWCEVLRENLKKLDLIFLFFFSFALGTLHLIFCFCCF